MFDAVDTLQRLIRMDTSNPPGGERAAVDFIRAILEEAGVPVDTYARDPDRPNLVARVPGTGGAPPLLLHAHIDVVPVTGQRWDHDPFGGDLVDGVVWGRGALDMKGPLVMMLDVMLRLAADPPARDVILAVVCDEERGGTAGARHLVEQHPSLFDGVRHALGEFGGFPLDIGGTRFYPIQIAERVGVRFELVVRGPGGHGSLPSRGGAMARAGRILTKLDRRRLPIHITPPTRAMLEAMAAHTSGATKAAIRSLLDPRTAPVALRMAGDRLRLLEPTLRNTVAATGIRGGGSQNVVPSEVRISLDGRMLPGRTVAEFESELLDIVGTDVEIERSELGGVSPADPDLDLFGVLAEAIRAQDPDGVPVPFLLPAVTDGRWFATLGIQTYGFTPMSLPEGFPFQRLVHGENERIPVDALRFGADAIHRVVRDDGPSRITHPQSE